MSAPIRPETRASALDAANAIADDIEAGLGREAGFSLAFGDAGFALLFDALARAGRPGAEERAREFLRSAARGVNDGGANASFYVGWPGVAFATTVVCGRDEAQQALRSATGTLQRGVERSPWNGRLDLTDGLVGLGVLALALLPDDDAAAAARSVVERFDELAELLGPGHTWRAPDDGDRVSVGVAHGVAGIVLFLADAHEKGIEPERTARLLDGAAEWLFSLEPTESGRRFPALALAPPEETSAAPNAWCWGDVGSALALARAAQIRHRADWSAAAVEAALAAAGRSPEDLAVADACFCHGSAGIAHVLRALGAVSGDARCDLAAVSWIDLALAERRPGEGIGGFTTAEYLGRPEERQADATFQLGATGTGLAVLAASGLADTGWDRAFLVPSLA